MQLILENYRCFVKPKRTSLEIGPNLTAIVGPNNAGKSALLRFFYECRPLFKQLHAMVEHGQIVDNIDIHFGEQSEYMFPVQNSAPLEFTLSWKIGEKGDSFAEDLTSKKDEKVAIISVKIAINREISPSGSHGSSISWTIDNTPLHTHAIVGKTIHKDSSRFSLALVEQGLNRLANACYISPFRHVLKGGGEANFDLTVGSALAANWASLRTRSITSGRTATKIQSLLESIFEYDRFEIQTSPTLDSILVSINGETLRLADVGSGLAQMFVIFLNVAEKQSKLVLLDEPEIGLHPRLQGDLLTALVEITDSPVIYSTHSLGLARFADKQYVISQRDKVGAQMKPFEPSRSLAEALGELSYTGYINMDSRKILLVEGDGDVKTFRMLLRALGIEHEIVVLSLGGNSQINAHCEDRLREVCRLSDQVFAIIDSEKSSKDAEVSADRKSFKRVCERLRIKCHILERTATENYFTQRSINATRYQERLKQLSSWQRPPDNWPKADNWLIAGEMTKEEFLGNDLGQFLQELRKTIAVS